MLSEVRKHRNNGNLRRRWFTSDAADLYIWADDGEAVSAFEYCYRLGEAEYSIRWDTRHGFEFGGIDDGESNPTRNRTPIRIADGIPPWGLIARHFRCEARMLDLGVFKFILDRFVEAARAATPKPGPRAG